MFEKILVKVVRLYFYIIIIPIGFLAALAIFVLSVAALMTFVLSVFVWLEDFSNGPPPDVSYKKRLEIIANVELPSCKVVKKTYQEDQYSGAIFKLSQDDFNKVLDAVQADSAFLCGSDIYFKYFTVSMLQEKGIDTLLVDYRYALPAFGDMHLHFLKQKSMIIFEK
jgi:hypothetical protein